MPVLNFLLFLQNASHFLHCGDAHLCLAPFSPRPRKLAYFKRLALRCTSSQPCAVMQLFEHLHAKTIKPTRFCCISSAYELIIKVSILASNHRLHPCLVACNY